MKYLCAETKDSAADLISYLDIFVPGTEIKKTFHPGANTGFLEFTLNDDVILPDEFKVQKILKSLGKTPCVKI